MSMTPFNGDLTQALKWMQNNAPNIQALVTQKGSWYGKFNDTFWNNWEASVFDLRTANPFGLMVWCIILGVPSQLFGLYPNSNAWAYGANRQNFVYSGLGTAPTIPVGQRNTVGGNFAGGGNTTLLNLNEVRQALQLRYVALVSNGRLSFINRMLRFIFNGDQPWNFAAGSYFYVVDSTSPAQTLVTTPPVTQDHYLEYRIGPAFSISAQFINLLNSPQYGITPTCAGSKYLVIKES